MVPDKQDYETKPTEAVRFVKTARVKKSPRNKH
jgi:hypothetical protein